MYAGAKKIDIVVAANDIPSGTTIREKDIGWDSIFESASPADVVTRDEWQQIVSKKVMLGVGKNRAILWGNIEGADKVSESSLAAVVRPGMRAISLAISGASAVSGMIQPNDRIDILGTFTTPSRKVPGEMETATITVLQDVTVLATGQTTAKQYFMKRRQAGSASYSTLTVEVTPREAELLIFAQQAKGNLFLALRNPSDVSFEKELPEVNLQKMESSLPELNQYRQKVIRHKTQ
jgi:pilus assembly protein CpaB